MSNDTRQEGQVSLDPAKDGGAGEGEILELEGRDLDVAVGHISLGPWAVIEPVPVDQQHSWDIWVRRHDDPTGGYMRLPAYHASLDTVQPVVAKCASECGYGVYCGALLEVMGMTDEIPPMILLATPTEIGRAVLLAYSRKAPAKADSQVGEALEPETLTSTGDPKERP